MPPELYRRARRAEAGAERAEDRRRRRLDFFRGALAEGLEALKQRHAEGASGEDSVHTHARFMDDVVASLSHLASDDAEAAGLTPTPYVVVALGGYGRGASWATRSCSRASAACCATTSTATTSSSSWPPRWPSASSAIASTAPRPTSASPTSRSPRAGCATCTRPCGWGRRSSARARC